MDKLQIIFIVIVTSFISTQSFSQSNNTLWCNRPAEYLEEALNIVKLETEKGKTYSFDATLKLKQ